MEKLKDELKEFHASEFAFEYEREVARKMISYMEEQKHAAFERTTRPAHFTGSALVVSPDRTKVLLMWHLKLKKWLQPGGHADGEADLRSVAAREVFEETGVEVEDLINGIFGVDWHPIPANVKEDAHEHADCAYLFLAKSWNTQKQEDEAGEVRWFLPSEALSQVEDGSVKKLLKRYFKEA